MARELIPREKPSGWPDNVKIIGLTGPMGSGKSEIARLLRAHGIPVIDVDALGHELLAPGGDAVQDIISLFGYDYFKDGGVDRKKLGEAVFQNSAYRQSLEAIMHPRMCKRLEDICLAEANKGYPFIVVDAALIAEKGERTPFLDALIVVDCPHDVCVQRLVKRNGFTEDEVERRMATQTPPEQKLAVADWVVHNGGSLIELADKVDRIVGELEHYGSGTDQV